MNVYQRGYGWLIVLLLMMAGCGMGSPPQPIRIGVIAPFSGEYLENGNVTREAVELAVQQINKDGGLLVGDQRRPIEVIYGDDQNKPDVALEVAKRLINTDRVVALIGAPFSSIAIPVGGVAEQAGIPFVSSTSTNPQTTQGRSFVFRATFTDPFQGQVLADFAHNNLKVSKAAILFDATSEYSQGISDYFRTEFTKLGGRIVADEQYFGETSDWTEQINRIKAANPDVVFIPNSYTEVPLQAEYMRKIGITQPLLGGDSWDVELNSQNPVFENTYVSQSWHPDVADETAKVFIESYKQTYNGAVPFDIQANTYDAIGLVFHAITTSGSTDATAIRDVLRSTKNYHGATGIISYNGSGDPIKSAVIVKITQGRSVYFQQVSPMQ